MRSKPYGLLVRNLTRHRLFWPVVVLALLLLFNLTTNVRFFSLTGAARCTRSGR